MKKTDKSKLAASGLEVVPKNERGASPFQARATVATPENVTIKSFSPILKPSLWPLIDGKPAVLVGVFTKIFPTKEFTRLVKGKKETVVGLGVEIIPAGAPIGVALPLTATLRTGLDVVGEGDKAISQYLGRTVEIELIGKVASKKGQDAWNFVVAIYPTDYKALN